LRRFARLPSRILAISAATFLGALGAVAFAAAPASAHTAALKYDVVCGETPGTANITWTVTNDQPNKVGTLRRVSRPVGEIKDDAKVDPLKSVSGTETVDVAKEPSITFSFRMRWKDADDKEVSETVDLAKYDCGPQEPAKEPTRAATSNCDGTLTVVVKNADDKARKVSVNGEGEFAERKTLAVNESWELVVPKEHAGKVTVKWKTAKENDDTDTGWEGQEKFNWAKPDTCFEVKSTSTCENLTITVANTGAKAIKATVTVGDQSEEKTIEPGDSADAVIDGVDGLVAKLSVNDGAAKEFAWTKPTDCGGGGGGLPVTGANAGLLAGAALVLVSGGGGLFYVARRRRVRFAA
jgi:LPXTG-motif cell wall-anchored protein